MLIYCLTNGVNGKKYVGQTVQKLSARLYSHRIDAMSRRGTYPLARAIRKYGWSAFSPSVLELCSTLDKLNAAETRWIIALDCVAPSGYNCTTGGDGYTVSPETARKRGLALRGYKHSPERNAKISSALKGRAIVWRDKIAAAMRGKKQSAEFIDQVLEIRALWATGREDRSGRMTTLPIVLCTSQRRGGCKNEAAPEHPCPYDEEINKDHEQSLCTCCDECTRECADDI